MKTVAVLCVLLALASAVTIDLSPLTLEYLVNTFETTSQFDPRIIEINTGNYVATWTDNGRFDGYDSYAQIITALGVKIGGEQLINQNLTGDSGHMTLTQLGDTNIVFCYTHEINMAFREVLCIIRTADLMTVIVPEFAATESMGVKLGWEYQPYIKAIDDGGFVMCYTAFDGNMIGEQVGVYALRFTNIGNAIANTRLNIFNFRDQRWCNLEVVGSNRLMFVWQSFTQDGSFDGVYGRSYDYALNPLTTEIQLNTAITTGRQERCKIRTFPRAANLNQVAISYGNDQIDLRWKLYDLSFNEVQAEVIVGNGLRRISDYTLDVLPSHNVLVCGEYDDGDLNGVGCSEYDADGTLLGGLIDVNLNLTGDQFEVAVAARSTGGMVAVWTSDNIDSGGFGIAGRTFDGSCNACGDPHIKSQWGCHFDAPLDQERAVLMECDTGKLTVGYNEAWDYHIHTVWTEIDGKKDYYRWKSLKHAQTKTICGNKIEFHRYILGINLRIKELNNHHFGGMFNDSSCIDWSKDHPKYADKTLLAA